VPRGRKAPVIILVTLPFGFQLFPVGALIGLLLLVVFGVGLGSLSWALAIAVQKQE
jgi:ABC-2 type transport system permease protein